MTSSASSTRPGQRAAGPPRSAGPETGEALTTERPSECHPDLDCYPIPELVDAFVDDQWHALKAVRAASPQIAAAVEAAVPRIAAGGRLVYAGAGTSGRLGVLDSVELYPTFSWPKDRAVALLAGGQQAMFEAVEGAEDSLEQGRLDLTAVNVSDKDVVILLAASGATPYVMGALEAARALGALTIGIANNPAAPVTLGADVAITLDTGSEVISGSTRLKAGTSQKIALNTLSSAIMVRLNKVYGNLMVDLQPTNAKLLRRAVSLTMRATGANEETARQALAACGYQVKIAIVAVLEKVDAVQAQERLAAAHGSVRAAIAQR
jgi:N-acetylmuramic acid 6-phosphate etherase